MQSDQDDQVNFMVEIENLLWYPCQLIVTDLRATRGQCQSSSQESKVERARPASLGSWSIPNIVYVGREILW